MNLSDYKMRINDKPVITLKEIWEIYFIIEDANYFPPDEFRYLLKSILQILRR